MLRRFLLNSRLSIAALVALVAMTGTMMMLSCSKDGPVQAPEPTWNFTVDVLDGNSGAKLSGAAIQYYTKVNNTEVDTVAVTNDQGRAKIEKLSAGTQSFTVSYRSADSVAYTSVVVKATSVSDSTGLSKLADQAKTVKLFPLSGSLSGKVVSQINDMAAKKPASGITVSVSYDNNELTDVTDVFKSVKTDSTGSFTFTDLPVASGIIVKFSSTTIGSIDFSAKDNNPTLVSKSKVAIGTVTMTPINAANFALLGTLPTIVAPNDTITLTYSDAVDSLSYAKLEGLKGAQSVEIDASVSGAKLKLKPAISLVDSSSYKLKVFAYGKAGGSKIDSSVITVIGGGIIDVVSSTVIDANHKAIDGLGLSAPMIFTFRTTISNANASVTLNSTPVLVDVSTYSSTLTILPKGFWEAGTYTVKVSANLSDGKASTFSFDISTAGALAFVSSNIYNPQNNSPINGLGIKDTIVVTANKKLSSCQATLTISGTSIPISTKLTSDSLSFKIKSSDDLRKATQYAFNITVFTNAGESKSLSANFTTANSDFYPIADNIRYDNDPAKPILNFPPMGTIVIKMSATVKSVTAQLAASGTTPVEANVSFSADTIKITPVANLDESKTYKLTISAESNAGTAYNEVFVNAFAVQANRAYVVSSNVMNSNGVGLTNVPVTIQPYFVFSATPAASSIFFTLYVDGTEFAARDTVIGDTIRIIPVKNLTAAKICSVSVKGKTTSNATIDFSTAGSAVFTTRAAVIMVATNMQDANGTEVTNLLPSSEVWVKFSRPLSTDLTKQEIGDGATALKLNYKNAGFKNAAIRVNGDTLFAKFLPNALPTYGDEITLQFSSILFDDATTISSGTIKAKIIQKATPSVIATNGMKGNVVIDTFNVLDEVWIVSSLSFRSVDNVKNVLNMGAAPVNSNLVPSTIRTHGDTIFFKPSIKLAYGTEYKIAVDVTLNDSSIYNAGNNLMLHWKTRPGLYIVSANDLASGNGAYRAFSALGDSLMITFNKKIDIGKPYSVTNLVSRLNYSWSSDSLVLKVKPLDTLKAKGYSEAPDYSITSGTAQYSGLSITVTAKDGEDDWASGKTANSAAFNNLRPDLAIHGELGIELLNTNLKVTKADTTKMYANMERKKVSDFPGAFVQDNNGFNTGDTVKLYFTRAVDSTAVALSTPHAIQLIDAGSVDQNVTIWYDAAKTTMFVKPVNLFTVGGSYTLKLVNVPASGLWKGDGSGKVSYGGLTFKVKSIPPKSVNQTAVTLYKDTALTSTVDDKRIGYSGSIGDAYKSGILPGDVAVQNKIYFYWKEVGFRSTADTVTHYQWSVKGSDNNWHDLKTMAQAHSHFNSFSPFVDSVNKFTLDLTSGTITDVDGANIASALKKTISAPQQNAASLFNNGDSVMVRVRPVVDMNANGDFDAGDQAGPWSNILTFKDNIAPCDNDFVGVGAELTNAAKGGVTIATPALAGGWNRPDDGGVTYTVTFTFPEDMDLSTKPTMNIYFETAPTTAIAVNDGLSYWSNARTYNLAVTIPGNIDWRASGTYKPYCAFSVNGMKDASGQTIQSFGSRGTAATGTTMAAASGTQSVGTVNMRGLQAIAY